MQMNPYDYYDIFVRPNYEDFCADEASVRKAFNAALSLVHMTDNYFNYFKKQADPKVAAYGSLKDFKIYLSGQSPYFNDLQSIANAYKHLYTNSGNAYVTVESGGAISAIEVENSDITVIDGLEQDNSGNFIVVYHKKDGTKVRVKTALDEVLKIWQGLI